MNPELPAASAPSPSLSVGQRLRRERLRLGWSQERLAEVLQTSAVSVSRWERDVVLPQPHYQQQLAQALHSTVETLFPSREPGEEPIIPPLSMRYWSVPFLRNFYFTGRQEVLEYLHSRLSTSRNAGISQPQAMSGLGGIGKTQIALEYAYRHASNYTAVFWIAAETPETIIESFTRIAEVLALPEQAETEQQRVVNAVLRWLTTHSRWLLIWDNVEDAELFQRFAPKADQGALLLTTRQQALGTLAMGIELSLLSPSESLLFLLRRARLVPPHASQDSVEQFTQVQPAQAAAARELVALMDGLPLALDQVGAYVEEMGCSLLDYLQQYQHRQSKLLQRRGSLALDYPQSVATTWLLSFERVEQQNPAAVDCLKICAFLHPDGIPEEIFTQGSAFLGPTLQPVAADRLAFDQALANLRTYSLLRRNTETKTLVIHRLVQAVLKEYLTATTRSVWAKRAVLAVNAAFPRVKLPFVEPGAWPQCERLLPQAATTAQLIEQYQIIIAEAGRLLYETASYLYARARYTEAELLYQRALQIQEQVLGPEHPELATSLNSLANLSRKQGQYVRAASLYQRALHIREQQLGPEHPRVASSLDNLATLYKEQGQYAQAALLHQRALHIREQQLGPEHPELAISLNNLAIIYGKQEKYEEAEPLYWKALRIWKHHLGPEHPDVAYPLTNLAELFFMQGKYEQAEALYQEALRIWEQHLGPEHPDVADPLNGLANLYCEQGFYEQAEPLYRRALCIWEQRLGSEHPDVAYPLNGLANLYCEQGFYEQAEPLYQRALTIREQVDQHPDLAQTLHDLAICQQKQGHLSRALSLVKHALEIRSRALGDTHPQTAKAQQLLTRLRQEYECARERGVSEQQFAQIPEHHGKARELERTTTAPQEQGDPPQAGKDALQAFLSACCELHPRAWCRASDLWRAYLQWEEEHQEWLLLSRRAFAAQLKAHGCRADRTSTARIWRGIALVGQDS